jgi:N-formylglutamate deformylase
MLEPAGFEVVGGDPASPYIVHVPHSSTTIPDDVRTRLLLDDHALAKELHLMTDARTEELARRACRAGRPSLLPGQGAAL